MSVVAWSTFFSNGLWVYSLSDCLEIFVFLSCSRLELSQWLKVAMALFYLNMNILYVRSKVSAMAESFLSFC